MDLLLDWHPWVRAVLAAVALMCLGAASWAFSVLAAAGMDVDGEPARPEGEIAAATTAVNPIERQIVGERSHDGGSTHESRSRHQEPHPAARTSPLPSPALLLRHEGRGREGQLDGLPELRGGTGRSAPALRSM